MKGGIIDSLHLRFNSLPTGKRTQRIVKFILVLSVLVSIPFQRESVPKVNHKFRTRNSFRTRFNSLPTGKCTQSSRKTPQRATEIFVSIPFKRESVPKVHYLLDLILKDDLLFQFPSNGKAYPKSVPKDCLSFHNVPVSIPFKRESVPKVAWSRSCSSPTISLFQFPSNGKADPKTSDDYQITTLAMSDSFNSLQTGKRTQSQQDLDAIYERDSVSIPFQRESVPKANANNGNDETTTVSIPFQRESVPKVFGTAGCGVETTPVSIPFKRESVPKVFTH